MIIVEGPDCTGKSTLVRYLSKTTGMPMSAHSLLSDEERNDPSYRSHEAVRERVYQSVLSMVAGGDAPEIHDRLFFSELVYSHVFGRECAFTYAEQRHICRVMTACRIPVFFCIPPFKELRKNIAGTDQMEGALERIVNIYNSYVVLAKGMSRKKIKGVTNRDQPYDYSMPAVTLYDFTREEHKRRALEVVTAYIHERKRRGGGWYTDIEKRRIG